MRCTLLVLFLVFVASPALAQDDDFCVDRPGLGTPACTLKAGQAMVELGLGNWQRVADAQTVEDDASYGEALLRVGIDDRTELQLGFGGYGTQRLRDRASGARSRSSGFGDALLGVRRSLSGPSGPFAVEAFVTLPIGSNGFSAGDWGAGVQLPLGFDLPAGFELDLTPEVDAAVNASGTGRHLAWGGVAGLTHALGPKLALAIELGVKQDSDPARHSTAVLGAMSVAWQVGRDWQIDLEGDLGLTAAAPRHSVLVGLARRF